MQAEQRKQEKEAPSPTPGQPVPGEIDKEAAKKLQEAVMGISGKRKEPGPPGVEVKDEPYTEEQLKAAEDKPPQHGEEDIGAKLRGLLGLGMKGKKEKVEEPGVIAPVQETEGAPAQPEVPGKSGVSAKKPLGEGEARKEQWVEGTGWVEEGDDDE